MTKIIDNTFPIAKLVSCVEELQNVGDIIPESKLYETPRNAIMIFNSEKVFINRDENEYSNLI